MDYHKKVIILKKYFNKYAEDRNIEDMRNTINSMKVMHGKIISTMLEVKDSNESNRLEVLSDLDIVSKKMSDIIVDATENYDKMMATKSDKEHNDLRKEASESIEQEHKVDLHDNENKKLNKNASSLILFYADWCGPCKAFLPTWNYLESNIKHEKLNIVKFSCVTHKQECDKIKFITSFPTVVLFNPETESVIKYDDQRDPNKIIDFINEQLKIDIKHIG